MTKLVLEKGDVRKLKTDVLIVGAFDTKQSVAEYDKALNGALAECYAQKQFTGDFLQLKLFNTLGKLPAKNILLVGLGKEKDLSAEKLRKAAGLTAKAARDSGFTSVATTLPLVKLKDATSIVGEGTLLGLYQFTKYKTVDKEKIKTVATVRVCSKDPQAAKALTRARILADAANLAKDITNTPAYEMTPTRIGEIAKKVARESKLKVTVYDKKGVQKLGMTALLAVNSGSAQEPRFIVLEHKGSTKKPIVFAGKGITFDSGGLNIKPGSSMEDMKCDKGGAAAVMGIMKAVAELKLPVHVIGLIATTENMPGAGAYKPGDVIPALNKKTIEVLNTDAEGRVILADALSYAERLKPAAIIDLATLTGACVVALGSHFAGLMGTDQKLIEKIKKAADQSGERVWELPLVDEFREAVKSENADVRNIAVGKSYEGGAITAGAFLNAFADKSPWAHLDIAGVAFLADERQYTQKGGTGFGVRLLVTFLQEWK